MGLEINKLFVGDMVLPASEDDSDPLVSESAKSGVVFGALGDLLVVEGTGPEAFWDGLADPFDEGLVEEMGLGEAAMNVARVAALFGDRGDPGEAQDLVGMGKA